MQFNFSFAMALFATAITKSLAVPLPFDVGSDELGIFKRDVPVNSPDVRTKDGPIQS